LVSSPAAFADVVGKDAAWAVLVAKGRHRRPWFKKLRSYVIANIARWAKACADFGPANPILQNRLFLVAQNDRNDGPSECHRRPPV
jgi:hypothetical protein